MAENTFYYNFKKYFLNGLKFVFFGDEMYACLMAYILLNLSLGLNTNFLCRVVADMLETQSIEEYFRELVKYALRNQGLETKEEVEYYIVHLLSECMRTETVYGVVGEAGYGEPLALALGRALSSGRAEREVLFKRIGDFSLFISGFFGESIKGKVVDVGYYISMGESAYGQLASADGGRWGRFKGIFEELSEKFSPFVEVITEVSEISLMQSLEDVLVIYERWMETRGERYKRLLEEKNVLPLDIQSGKKLH